MWIRQLSPEDTLWFQVLGYSPLILDASSSLSSRVNQVLEYVKAVSQKKYKRYKLYDELVDILSHCQYPSKIFYISKGRIILKRKYKEISKCELEEFLANAKDLEGRVADIENEKRDLDFKSIVYSEIKNQESKAVVFIEDNNYIEVFIEKLLRL